MKRFGSSRLLLAVAGCGVLAVGTLITPNPRVAEGAVFDAPTFMLGTLLGANEVPSVGDPDGAGSVGLYVYQGFGNDVCWTFTSTGIDTITGVQLHSGAAGVNGPVVVDFGVALDTCAVGPLDDAMVADLIANPANYYVNVDTAAYPTGALRGQLVSNGTPLGFVGLATPLRAYDSRTGGTALSPNETRDVSLLYGTNGAGVSLPAIPEGAYSAQVVITVTQTNAAGYLTTHASGTPVPTASTINWSKPDTTVAVGTVVRIDATGHLAITAGPSASTHLIVDVLGFYIDWGFAGSNLRADALSTDWAAVAPAATELVFVGLETPQRAYDSRAGGTKIAPSETRDILLRDGTNGAGVSLPAVPIGAYAAQVVITVTQSNTAGYLTAHATGTPVPETSTINWSMPDTTVAVGTIVRVDGTSRVAITAGPGANTHVIIDVIGFYWDWNVVATLTAADQPAAASPSPLESYATQLSFFALATPQRAYDSRVGGVKLSPNETRDILLFPEVADSVFGAAVVPIYAAQVVITVTQTNEAGYLTAHATGTPVPATSTINWTTAGASLANGTVVNVDATGHMAITAGPSANTHVIIDVIGVYVAWDTTPI
ncbi:MAG: CHRD domain-containing protein [Actinomycetia bacterium]|nr:CHRD domain-containing protein [Actinomycetes bacterium]